MKNSVIAVNQTRSQKDKILKIKDTTILVKDYLWSIGTYKHNQHSYECLDNRSKQKYNRSEDRKV